MCKAERRGPDDRCRRKSVASVVVDEITTPSRPASSDYSSLVERNGNRVQIALVFERERERERERKRERMYKLQISYNYRSKIIIDSNSLRRRELFRRTRNDLEIFEDDRLTRLISQGGIIANFHMTSLRKDPNGSEAITGIREGTEGCDKLKTAKGAMI